MSAWPEAIWLKNQLQISIDALQDYTILQEQVDQMENLVKASFSSASTYIKAGKNQLPEAQQGALGFIYYTIEQ